VGENAGMKLNDNGGIEICVTDVPIQDKVAMSLVVVPRKGIRAIQTGGNIIPINKKISKVSETFSGDRSGARIASCT
jgi:hypothetical protein